MRKPLRRETVATLVLVGVCGVWMLSYRSEAREIRRLAEKCPGVRVVYVGGDASSSIEQVRLIVEIQGVRVGLQDVQAIDFRAARHLRLTQIGPWGFKSESYRGPIGIGPPAVGGFAEVSQFGDLGQRLGVKLKSIPELFSSVHDVLRTVDALSEAIVVEGVVSDRGRNVRIEKTRLDDPEAHDRGWPGRD